MLILLLSQPASVQQDPGPQSVAHQAASQTQPGLASNAAGAAGALAGWAFTSIATKVRQLTPMTIQADFSFSSFLLLSSKPQSTKPVRPCDHLQPMEIIMVDQRLHKLSLDLKKPTRSLMELDLQHYRMAKDLLRMMVKQTTTGEEI